MRFSIAVAADAGTAWSLISDIQRHGEWSPQEFEAKKLDGGPIGVGTRYRTAGRKGVRKGVLRSTDVVVTTFAPTSMFGFEATEKAGVYRTTFTVSPSGTGSSIERVVQPPSKGFVPFIRHVLLAPLTRWYVQQNMDALKAKLDASTRRGASPQNRHIAVGTTGGKRQDIP
jgi:Polyketide cyclase / dehydrase and lipid transport